MKKLDWAETFRADSENENDCDQNNKIEKSQREEEESDGPGKFMIICFNLAVLKLGVATLLRVTDFFNLCS